MTAKRLRVGIISANWGVSAHLPAWRAVDGIEVAAICTAHRETAEGAASAHGIHKAYWDYRQMAADPTLDIIDVGTRPALRYHMAKAALEQGKHIYAGIPYAADQHQATELTALAEARRLKGSVDAFVQWLPAHQAMKEMIAAGALGRLFAARLHFEINLFNPPPLNFPWYWFSRKENGASALRNLGSHALHTLVYLFGEVAEAIGQEARFLDDWNTLDQGVFRPEVGDTATALLKLESGAQASLSVSWVATGGGGWRLEAFGERGRFTTRDPATFPTATGTELWYATPSEPPAPAPSWRDKRRIEPPERLARAPHVRLDRASTPEASYPMALAFEDLKRAILDDREPQPSLRQALHVERVIGAITRSTASRRWETVI